MILHRYSSNKTLPLYWTTLQLINEILSTIDFHGGVVSGGRGAVTHIFILSIKSTVTGFYLGPYNLERDIAENTVKIKIEVVNFSVILNFDQYIGGREMDSAG